MTAELVVAFPLLLILVFSVVQFALYEHAAHVAEAVAEEALTTSRVAGGSDDTGNAAAQNLLGQLGNAVLKGATVTTNRGATTTTVTVTGDAEAMLPIYHLPVTVTASGVTEVFTPSSSTSSATAPAGGGS